MAEKDFLPLTQNVVRGLNDKLYEKRKTAALEIERYVCQVMTCFPEQVLVRVILLRVVKSLYYFWRSPALFSFIYVLYTSSKRKVVVNQT